jgi:hypothetical protein
MLPLKALCISTLTLIGCHGYSTSPPRPFAIGLSSLSSRQKKCLGNSLASALLISSIFVGCPVLADEYGQETEAPTLFTGETVMVSFLINLKKCLALPQAHGTCKDLCEAWTIRRVHQN